MRITSWSSFLLIFALAAAPLTRSQQQTSDERYRIPPVDIAATFTTERSKIVAGDCGCFWLQGGTAEANIHVLRNLSAAVALTGSHAANITSGVDLTQIAVMAGPRYTYRTSRWTKRAFGEQRGTSAFAEVLFGGVHAIDGLYPSSTGLKTNATAFSLQAGGGFNIWLVRGLGLRAIEIDYVRTSLPNGTTDSQHDLRLAFGITYHLHR
jgi:outer membrane immunogenic protein